VKLRLKPTLSRECHVDVQQQQPEARPVAVVLLLVVGLQPAVAPAVLVAVKK